MNQVRERILLNLTPYTGLSEHKDLISFCVSCEYFTDYGDKEEPDFNEIVVIVEKEWLFEHMQVENPLEYLRNEYTSDDSIEWFEDALTSHKVVMVSFN